MNGNNGFEEKHYRLSELATMWGLSRATVRKLVMNDPEVVKVRMGPKKAHTIYSVPESVAERIHTSLLNPESLPHSPSASACPRRHT